MSYSTSSPIHHKDQISKKYKHKTAPRPSYSYNGDPYTSKMIYLLFQATNNVFPPLIQNSSGTRSCKTSRWNTMTGLFSKFDNKVAEYRGTTYLVITAYAPANLDDDSDWHLFQCFFKVFLI